MTMQTRHRAHQVGALTAAVAATLIGANQLRAGQTGDLVTISLSGSTAMRNFTTSAGFSFLTPGTSVVLNAGAGGAPLMFSAPNSPTTQFQLAPSPFPAVAPEQNGVRVEWHEQGSVEGILELANDQAGMIGGLPNRDPSSGNPVWVNRNRFTAPGSANGFTIGSFGGANGQNAVQMAISDVNARQGFSRVGAGTFTATPTSVGYGQGNQLLTSNSISGLGQSGARQQLQPETVLNLPAGANGAGPWNSAGVDNTNNVAVAVTATLMVANPGTGLTKMNRTDAQWLQTTGRLANGADFNMAQRDVNSGTRNVIANNTGVDPTWAVGEHDDGDNSSAAQNAIGGAMRFSGKTAGSALRTAVQNSRMGVGPLSISDAIGAVKGPTASITPLRALDYGDHATDAGGTFVRASAASITDGSYVIWQNETYVTIKAPSGTFAGDNAAQWAARTDSETGIKGDNAGNDVADMRGNIVGSVFNFPASNSVANPADQLLATSFILPQMMQVTKTLDGVGQAVANPQYNSGLRSALIGSGYATNFAVGDPSQITKGAAGAKYNGAATGTTAGDIPITDNGSGGGNWLFGNFNQDGKRDYAAVVIAAQDAQAKLFASGAGVDANSGSVNSSSVASLSAPLASMIGQDGTAGAKKGDLIVMGDFNSDGKFDGKDLYAMARGAALADGTTSTHLTAASGATLGDQLRNGVLRKNAALDYLYANATPQQRADAAAVAGNSATAFRKEDANHDGAIDLKDAKLVDYFAGKDYRNINHQLAAVQGADGDSAAHTQSTTFKPINLVDVEMNDTGSIDTFDFRPVRLALGAALKDGDTDFNGIINFDDYSRTDNGFNTQTNPGFIQSWSKGDFDSNGVVNFDDYSLIDFAFNQQGNSVASALAYLEGRPADMSSRELQKVVQHFNQFGEAYANSFILQAVPEPTTASVALIALARVGSRRRHRKTFAHKH